MTSGAMRLPAVAKPWHGFRSLHIWFPHAYRAKDFIDIYFAMTNLVYC